MDRRIEALSARVQALEAAVFPEPAVPMDVMTDPRDMSPPRRPAPRPPIKRPVWKP